MAKTKTPRTSDASLDSTLVAYAETLGTAMGTLRNHVDQWKGQRTHLVSQLSAMVKDAQGLLADLGHSATEGVRQLRGGGGRKRKGGKRRQAAPNPAGGLKPASKRGSRKLTEAGRAAISAAQKARWAAYKNKRVPK